MVEETARRIEEMEVRGAGSIARAAARALADEASTDTGDPEKRLREARDRLLDTRPTAVSLHNGVNYVLKPLHDGETGPELAAAVAERAEEFVENSEKAVETIGRIGAGRIPEGATVLTHCNSQAALSAITTAHDRGKDIQVITTETRPRDQGYINLEQLSDAGVPVSLVVDSAVLSTLPEADVVVTGADAVTADGRVANKIGTSQVALCSRKTGVPLFVCAETYKFHPGTAWGDEVKIEHRDPAEIHDPSDLPGGVEIRNPAFDLTPPRHVDAIVTEEGAVAPEMARWVIENYLETRN